MCRIVFGMTDFFSGIIVPEIRRNPSGKSRPAQTTAPGAGCASDAGGDAVDVDAGRIRWIPGSDFPRRHFLPAIWIPGGLERAGVAAASQP